VKDPVRFRAPAPWNESGYRIGRQVAVIFPPLDGIAQGGQDQIHTPHLPLCNAPESFLVLLVRMNEASNLAVSLPDLLDRGRPG
jgi:hypothetical protein